MKGVLGEEKRERVVTFLDRAEVDFLDKLGKDALFSTGVKISRAKLIAWLVDFIKKPKLNGEGIKSEKDFENRIQEALGPKPKGSVPHLPRLSAVAKDKNTLAKTEKVDNTGGIQ